MLSDAVRDLSFALRVLRKSPLATATIVLCLGFSIGATATVTAWMEGLVLRPVRGVPELERLVSLETTTATSEDGNVSWPAYRDLRDELRAGDAAARRRALDGIAAFGIRRFNLRATADAAERRAEPVWGMLASASYFDVLRVRPVLGRGFLPADDSVAGREPVAVIGHALWQRRFGGEPGVLGRRIWLNGREVTVVGVAPPDFKGTISGLVFDVWTPVTMHPALADDPNRLLEQRESRWLNVFARLAPGATLDGARAQARAMGTRLAAAYEEEKDRGLRARTLDVGPTERLTPLFAIMLGITVLVLLIVCTNVANLLMLRGAGRAHELAVRLALGARPGQLVGQLMTESVLLAAAGVALGVALGAWGAKTFGSMFPESPLPVVVDTPIDGRVLLRLAAVGVATVLLFGLAPAVRTARAAGRISLAGGARGTTAGGARVRGALVGAQFALSLAVLVVSGLFLRRLRELERVDRGFHDAERVLLATVDFELAGVRGDSARRRLVERLVERVGALPGVRAASAATFVPLGFLGFSSWEVGVEGYAPRPGESMTFLTNRVAERYFETMRHPVVRGRGIEAADRAGALDVAVVNEAFAARFWGAADPVGRRIRVAGRPVTVVGVAADGKYVFTDPLDGPSPPFVYLPFAQWGSYAATLHIRAEGTEPLALLPAVRRAVDGVQPDLTLLNPQTLETYSSIPLFPVRVGSGMLGALGGAALVLAALGLYAVIGYAVTQRRREIGVRMALGATPGRLVAGFLGEAGRWAGAGAAVGLALAALIVRVLHDRQPYLVPEAGAAFAGSFGLALGVLAAVAAVAAVVPARRAAAVSPTVALRED